MTKTLEQEAREAAEGFADSVDAETGRTICKGSYMNGYLAAATARDKEIAALREELNDWRETARKAADESCSDEAHCTCVGALRKLVADLSALVRYVTFHSGYYSYQSQKTRDESYYFTPAGVGGGGVERRLPDEFQEAARIAHGVPPIQLPEGE